MRPIFKTKMLVYQSKADFDEKILFGRIIHILRPKIEKCLSRACIGTRGPCSILVNILFAIEIKILFLKQTTRLNSNSNARQIMDQNGVKAFC